MLRIHPRPPGGSSLTIPPPLPPECPACNTKPPRIYSPTPTTAQHSGQRTHGTFNTWSNNGLGDSSRSVNKTFYRTGSDPHTNEQSQGHRPKGCGPAKPNHKPSPLDYAFYIRNQARDLGENTVDNVQDFAEDPQGILDEWEKDIKSRLRTNWAKGMADINSGRIFSVKH